MPLIHASCVFIAGAGVLIRGPSGAGKSDLALRLIDGGGELVADDYCDISAVDGALAAVVPDNIAGKLEVRGLAIVQLPYRSSAMVSLVVDLMPGNEIERLPAKSECTLEGIAVPCLALDAKSASAAAKVKLALQMATGGLHAIS